MISESLFLVRPVRFGFNRETAVDNVFQHGVAEGVAVQALALKESDALIAALEAHGIQVAAVDDTPEPETPDSVYPNNWFSSHADGTLVIYPMFAPNRRLERKPAVVARLIKETGASRVIDLTGWEKQGKFLEGTGSMVLDRDAKVAYACLSERTSPEVLADFCRQLGYTAMPFKAVDPEGRPIYHTNLMMSVGSSFAVLCREAFVSQEELKAVESALEAAGKAIVDLSFAQICQYAANVLEVANRDGERFILMSETARTALREDQLAVICQGSSVLSAPVPIIETIGGGSVRCMVAELFTARAL